MRDDIDVSKDRSCFNVKLAVQSGLLFGAAFIADAFKRPRADNFEAAILGAVILSIAFGFIGHFVYRIVRWRRRRRAEQGKI